MKNMSSYIPKSSTFLFIIISIFLLFIFISYFLLYINLSDNHKKNQEIVFYKIQKDTSIFLSKLLFKFSNKKEILLEKHKEVLKYLEKNSLKDILIGYLLIIKKKKLEKE